MKTGSALSPDESPPADPPEPESTDTEGSPSWGARARAALRRRRPSSWAWVAVVVFVAFGFVHLVRPLGRPFTTLGDVAFIEIGVRAALHGGTALGVYSRFGWHEPGPALFYLMTPAYWLSGESSRSLYLSAWLINGSCALAAVAIVRRRAGESAARIMAIAELVLFLVLGFRNYIDPWNPRLLALPLLLLMVSTAAAYSGSAWSAVVALVAASYLMQTHIATVPVAGALLLTGAIGLVVHRTRANPASPPASRARRWAPAGVGVALLALAWTAPVVQQLTNHDGNLQKIAHFYTNPGQVVPTSHSLSSSLTTIADPSTALLLGAPHDVRSHGLRTGAAVALCVLGLVVAMIQRRRRPFIAALGFVTAIGLVGAVFAASRVIGTQESYLFYWTETLAVPVVVAVVALVVEWVQRRVDDDNAAGAGGGVRARAVSLVSVVALVALVGACARVVVRSGDATTADAPEARTAARRIEASLPDRNIPFVLRVTTRAVDRGAIAVQLDKDGYAFRFQPPVNLYAGTARGPVAGPTFVVLPARVAARMDASEVQVATFDTFTIVRRD